MLYFDTQRIADNPDIKVVRSIERRRITHVFHDIDGTHSLIRNWQPVMSRVLYFVIENGLPNGYDGAENIKRLIEQCGIELLAETDNFCVESAGLSALTQMEWAIRRAIQNGTITNEELPITERDQALNKVIVQRIMDGTEVFDDYGESSQLKSYLQHHTPRLFRLYEQVLNGYCRDKNLALARQNPDDFLVNGSMDFMDFLYSSGVKNYFVTGAVVDTTASEPCGMYEEVLSLGFQIGHGKTVEAICGSTWDEKIPKDEVMRRICRDNQINPQNVLVIGDGRSEIAAGSEMGAVTVGVLPKNAVRQRELHRTLGVNVIVENYASPLFERLWLTK